jgi:DNA polymerase III sliding clamp (beta) subunit (PCNA family)
MLLEILGSIKDEKIKITMKEPTRASLIYGEDMKLFYLLMPVLTQ